MTDLKQKTENLYAKSNPEETIREHTDNLLHQAELLKKCGYITERSTRNFRKEYKVRHTEE